MLVADGNRRSNLRVLYGILAQSALHQIDAHEGASRQQAVYFQNLIRLLEMYRYGKLSRPSPRAVLDRRQADLRQVRRDKLEAEAVASAIQAAHENVYPGTPAAQVIDRLVAIFSRVSRSDAGDLQPGELSDAKRFLEKLADALRR